MHIFIYIVNGTFFFLLKCFGSFFLFSCCSKLKLSEMDAAASALSVSDVTFLSYFRCTHPSLVRTGVSTDLCFSSAAGLLSATHTTATTV